MAILLGLITVARHELALFSAVGFIVGGADNVMFDIIWLGRVVWRKPFIYSRYARIHAATLDAPGCGTIVVFIPAWDESQVIGAMLCHAKAAFGISDYLIYVGCYPNDPETLAAVRPLESPQVRLALVPRQGPTTKADCLNTLWLALRADEDAQGWRAKAIVLHDAEDVVHSAELGVFGALIERFDFVQLPVLPLIDRQSRWVGGHYLDEFAEAHGKTMVVREAVGAGIPAAGVGCAFSRAIMSRIAEARDGAPFDGDSLTEDYELGLRIAELGGRGIFVRMRAAEHGAMVAVRAHFPATLEAAVRQKSRWIAGIALSGWDRLGWRGGVAEGWMRLHDRRAPLAALVLLAGYAALAMSIGIGIAGALTGWHTPPLPSSLRLLLAVCGFLLIWRLAIRSAFVAAAYGWAEGLRAVPRSVISNLVAILAAWRAAMIYLRMRRDGVVRWDKTRHDFPLIIPAE